MVNLTDSLAGQDRCTYCWEPLDNGFELTVLHPTYVERSLQHIFHKACIESWLGEHSRCPLCDRIVVEIGQVTPSERMEAIIIAIQEENQAHVVEFLTQGPISNHDRGLLLLWVSQLGLQDMVTVLLASGPLSKEHHGLAVVLAAAQGHSALVTQLLAHRSVSEKDLMSVVIAAVSTCNLRIIPLLIGGKTLWILSCLCLMFYVGLHIPNHTSNKLIYIV